MFYRWGILITLVAALFLAGCAHCRGTQTPCPTSVYNCKLPWDCCLPRCRPACEPDWCWNVQENKCAGSGRWELIKRLSQEGVQVVELGDYVSIIFYTDNCYDPGSANLNDCCGPVLDDIVKLIQCYGRTCGPVHVTGYTDNIGNVCCKCPLSQHLADSVVAYLWAHGIPLDQLHPTGRGCQNILATTHTPWGNAYNRRVEITMQRVGS